MARMFDVAELVQVAVKDETAGVAFYSTLAQTARHPALRACFAGLANQERYHQKRFEDMLRSLGGYQAAEQYPDEYLDYVTSLTTTRAFPEPEAAQQQARACASDEAAIDLALRFERDTLVLMNEMRGMVREKDRAIVDELIREERQHVVDLAAARQQQQH